MYAHGGEVPLPLPKELIDKKKENFDYVNLSSSEQDTEDGGSRERKHTQNTDRLVTRESQNKSKMSLVEQTRAEIEEVKAQLKTDVGDIRNADYMRDALMKTKLSRKHTVVDQVTG